MKRITLAVAFAFVASALLADTQKINLFNAVKAQPSAAAGDMYYTAGSTGTILRLPIGSSGQCLKVTTGFPAWGSCGGGGGSSSPLTTKGDLWGFSTVDDRVPVGSNGQLLVADSTAGVGVSWRLLLAADIPAIPESGVTSLVSDLAAKLPLAGGTMSGAIDMGSHKITSLTNGSSAQDAAAFGQIPTGVSLVPTSPSDATKFLNGAATPAFAQVKDSDLSTSNVTTNNATTSKHGFVPILPNDATKYYDGTGAYSQPPLFSSSAQGEVPSYGLGVPGSDFLTSAGWQAISGFAVSTRNINTTAPLTGGGDLSADRTLGVSDFVASGGSHARGTVPDPGSSAGTTKFLREDATWGVPPGTSSGTQGGTTSSPKIPYASGADTLADTTAEWDDTDKAIIVKGSTTTTPRGLVAQQSNAGAQSARLFLRKSRGSPGSETAANSGDNAGAVAIQAYDGSAWADQAQISSAATGAPSGGFATGDLEFYTANGAALKEWLRIKATGEVLFQPATSGTGTALKSPATGGGGPTFTLPAADGSAGQVIKTNGSGVLSFTTVAGGGGSGNVSSTGAAGSEPSAVTGDLYLANNGMTINRNADGTTAGWANTWGPIFPFTFPPLVTSTQTTTISHGGGYTSGATSFNVASSSGFPSTPFLVTIGSEDIKVTTVSGTTWTVSRGYNGTTAASVADGATITQLNWEWVNKGASSTVAQVTNQGIFLDGGTDSAGNNLRIYKRLIVNTTSGDLQTATGILPNTTGSVGVMLRESGTGKIAYFSCFFATGFQHTVGHWSSATAFTANDLSTSYTMNPTLVFQRITISGSNILYKVSFDGQHWLQLLSVAKTTQFTTAPDEWGIYANPVSTSTSAGLTLYSFKEN